MTVLLFGRTGIRGQCLPAGLRRRAGEGDGALPRLHLKRPAHPTGRIINRRPPFEFDLEEVLAACVEHDVAVELNAHPERLDLKDTHLMRAKELGAKIVISTDAHRASELALMRYGIDQARRAWLTKQDVLNTRSLKQLLKALKKSRRGVPR